MIPSSPRVRSAFYGSSTARWNRIATSRRSCGCGTEHGGSEMCLSREQPRRPPLSLQFEPRFCSNHVADLSAGCSFGCIYCPFADIAARRIGVTQPTATERAPMEGGQAWSVPLARKIDTYSRLAELANTHGLRFNTC